MRRSLLLAGLVAATLTATLWAKPLPRKDRDPEAMDERTPRVIMETNHGRIVIELNAEKAPISVKNFLQYVDAGHYKGMIFHRTIDKFMIQGGGFVPGMTEKKTRDPIKLEDGNGLSNLRGTIAMARTSDPNSGTAQFFINTFDNQRLDRNGTNPGYAVFGKVVEGMDVVDKISQVPTGTRAGHANVPTEDVVMQSVRRVK